MPGEPTFGESLTMDEIESQIAASEAQPAEDDLPEAYRGKSPKEIAAIAEAARNQLNERLDFAKIAAEAARGAAPAPPPKEEPAAPQEMTREQLKELYEEDPMKALEIMENQVESRLTRHFESRLQPMAEGIVGQAENWARQEFATEFELFGDEIKQLVENVGNKNVFTQKKAWEDAVAYVRGRAGNMEKLWEHRQSKQSEVAARDAREREARNSGFTGSNRGNASGPRASAVDNAAILGGMSEEEKVIAQRFIDDGVFKDFKEYQLWNRREGA